MEYLGEPPEQEGAFLLAQAFTDSRGRFSLEGVKAGEYRVIAQSWKDAKESRELMGASFLRGKVIELRGVADRIRIPSTAAEELELRPLGRGALHIHEPMPNDDTLLMVSTSPTAADPALGFWGWGDEFLRNIIGWNWMPSGETTVHGLPEREVYLALFQNDNAPGFGAVAVDIQASSTAEAHAPLVAGWSDGHKEPPERLKPLFEDVINGRIDISGILKDLYSDAPPPKHPGNVIARSGPLDREVELPDGRKVTVADLLAVHRYALLQGHDLSSQAEVLPSPEWKATLPNGVTVKLLGVSHNPSFRKPWWRPDGSPLEARPYVDAESLFQGRVEGKTTYEFALDIRNSAGEATLSHVGAGVPGYSAPVYPLHLFPRASDFSSRAPPLCPVFGIAAALSSEQESVTFSASVDLPDGRKGRVEFHNVSLRPGRRTNVEVVVTLIEPTDLLTAQATDFHVLTAAERGDVDVLKAMLERDPQLVNARSSAGRTALYRAASEGHAAVAEFLLSTGAEVALAGREGGTPIHVASYHGHTRIVELLLAHGADANAPDRLGRGPLHKAAAGGHVKTVQLLLSRGADVNGASPPRHDGPLHRAALYGHTRVAEVLLEHGAKVDGPRQGITETPLRWAASGGHVKIVELLLQNGADPNVQGDSGYSPLHRAASNGHTGVVELLLSAGADVDAENERGNTALHEAALNGDAEAGRLLLAAGAEGDVFTMAGLGDLDGVRALLDGQPALANGTEGPHGAPLMWAAGAGQLDVVELLLARGADPNGPYCAPPRRGERACSRCQRPDCQRRRRERQDGNDAPLDPTVWCHITGA
jgi:ankyrin repeat protein